MCDGRGVVGKAHHKDGRERVHRKNAKRAEEVEEDHASLWKVPQRKCETITSLNIA